MNSSKVVIKEMQNSRGWGRATGYTQELNQQRLLDSALLSKLQQEATSFEINPNAQAAYIMVLALFTFYQATS